MERNDGNQPWQASYHWVMQAELSREQWAVLRRRIEDLLRQSPAVLRQVAALLAAEEMIKTHDVIRKVDVRFFACH